MFSAAPPEPPEMCPPGTCVEASTRPCRGCFSCRARVFAELGFELCLGALTGSVRAVHRVVSTARPHVDRGEVAFFGFFGAARAMWRPCSKTYQAVPDSVSELCHSQLAPRSSNAAQSADSRAEFEQVFMNRERHQTSWPTTLRDGPPMTQALSDYFVSKRAPCQMLHAPTSLQRVCLFPVHAGESQVDPRATSQKRSYVILERNLLRSSSVPRASPEPHTVFLVVWKRTALWAQRGRSTPSPSFEPNFSNYILIPHCQRTHRLLLIQTGRQPSPTGDLTEKLKAFSRSNRLWCEWT